MTRDQNTTDAILRSIDSKFSALLALVLDAHIRGSGIAKPKERTIDRLLTDAGLSPQMIAALLGKTDRAVTLALQRERDEKETRRAKRATRAARAE